MNAYSNDLRQRVVAAYDARQGAQEQAAARFAVSTSRVRELLRRRRTTGPIEPKLHGGGHAPAFDASTEAKPRRAVRDDSDATPEESGRLAGLACSASAAYRTWDRPGIERQKSRDEPPSRAGPN